VQLSRHLLAAELVVVTSRPIGGEQLDRASDLRFCCFKNAPVLSWSSVHGVFDPSHGDQGPKETVNMGP
jgi:hypothetical protein